MLAMPDRRTKASAGHRTTQAGAGRLTFHMSVTPGMPVHGTNRTNRASLMMSANRKKPRARQTARGNARPGWLDSHRSASCLDLGLMARFLMRNLATAFTILR
jgi:hypothetical protein